MRIALAQLNPTVGDIEGNAARIEAVVGRLAGDADLVIFPELSILGYPPRDLLLRDGVVSACESVVEALCTRVPAGLTVVVGHPRRAKEGRKTCYNSASVLQSGEVVAVYDKQALPTYDVFDEDRYFEPCEQSCVFTLQGWKVGILICEDFWRGLDVAGSSTVRPRAVRDPLNDVVRAGAEIIIVPSASPFVQDKGERHLRQLQQAAKERHVELILVNQVGGNDDLIFDGRSVAFASDGSLRGMCRSFEEDVFTVDLSVRNPVGTLPELHQMEETFNALRLGVRDYFRKTGHTRAAIGLSGGIDSAVTAAIASAALGPSNVTGVMMPSRFSSPGSISDSERLAANLGIDDLRKVAIEDAHRSMGETIAPALRQDGTGVTDENIQARVRGIIMMAIANAEGSLVLATGNKSEVAVGYCTLYGDMCGALAVLGDLPKMQVYGLARWMNQSYERCGFDVPPIPEASLSKPPSAELRPDQTDQDSLPPYEVLDEIIHRAIDLDASAESIVRSTGFDADLVVDVVRKIDRNEYKRKQAAIVPKLQPRSFGSGRRMPVAMRWSPEAGTCDQQSE